jgi:hypothetical protein
MGHPWRPWVPTWYPTPIVPTSSAHILRKSLPYPIYIVGIDPNCRNPTLGEVGGWNSHSQSWRFGVLWDSRMFRVRQQRPNHLALGCSWCRWKGLEVQISKMPSHWSFGHLQPKLWAKEGPGVKLAVWLLTVKSRESTSFRHPNQECYMTLESSRWEL